MKLRVSKLKINEAQYKKNKSKEILKIGVEINGVENQYEWIVSVKLRVGS